MLLRIGPSWAAGLLTHEVQVTLGPSRQRGSSIVVPIEWEAVGSAALFPVLSGDLEISPLGLDQSRIALSASYVPPLGELGRRLDRAIMHRAAASTVRSFLHRLAASLEPSGAESALPTTESATGDVSLRWGPAGAAT